MAHMVLVQTFRKPGVCFIILSFLLLVSVGLIGGIAGPSVFITQADNNRLVCESTSNCTASWQATLVNMNPLHQILFLEASVQKPTKTQVAFKYEQQLIITAEAIGDDGTSVMLADHVQHKRWVTCPADTLHCGSFVLFQQSFIHYHTYKVGVQFVHPTDVLITGEGDTGSITMEFALHRINSAFSVFELVVRYTFVGVTLVMMLLYFLRLRTVPFADWSYEHKWISALLVLLLLFDNPIVALDIYSPSLLWTGISVFFLVTFLASMLTFWLCVLDVLRSAGPADRTAKRGKWFYAPKLVWAALFWIATLAIYTYTRLQQNEDPSYNTPDDLDQFGYFKFFALALVALYILYLVVLAVWAAAQLRQLSLQFRVLYGLSMGTILVCVLALFLGAYSPFPTNSLMFMVFYGMFNIYLWVLAISYLPIKNPDDEDMTELQLHGAGAMVNFDDQQDLLFAGSDSDDDVVLDDDRGYTDQELGGVSAVRQGSRPAAVAGNRHVTQQGGRPNTAQVLYPDSSDDEAAASGGMLQRHFGSS